MALKRMTFNTTISFVCRLSRRAEPARALVLDRWTTRISGRCACGRGLPSFSGKLNSNLLILNNTEKCFCRRVAQQQAPRTLNALRRRRISFHAYTIFPLRAKIGIVMRWDRTWRKKKIKAGKQQLRMKKKMIKQHKKTKEYKCGVFVLWHFIK